MKKLFSKLALVTSASMIFVACGNADHNSSSEIKRSPMRFQYTCSTTDIYGQTVFIGLNANRLAGTANGSLSITKNGVLAGTGVLTGTVTLGYQGWPSRFESWDLISTQTGLLNVQFHPDFMTATVSYQNSNGWNLTCRHG